MPAEKYRIIINRAFTRYLAHQFREILTHSAVNIPLSFASLISIEKRFFIGFKPNIADMKYRNTGIILFISALIIPVFIAISLMGRNILAEAQKKTGYWNLLASHYFEHSLDYVFVPALSVFFFVMFILISGKNRA